MRWLSYDDNLLQCGFTNDCIISAFDVKKAVSCLRAHKADGSFELITDHFLNVGDDLHVHIALIFSAMLVHGFSPVNLCTSTVIPVPKGHNLNATDKIMTFGYRNYSASTQIHR